MKIGKTADDKLITSTIHLRRRPDHDPIPSFEDYVGCPRRERLSVDEFAVRYGAHPYDIAQVSDHCRTHGMVVLHEHAARRHVTVQGTARQLNAAWGVTLHDHAKGAKRFHLPDRAAVVPNHLSDAVIHVGLGEPPMEHATPTNIPASTPGLNTTTILPSQYASLMGWPTNGTGQTIAIVTSSAFRLSDIQSNWSNWGIGNATIVTVEVDSPVTSIDSAVGEWDMDISMAHAFAVGATIAVYNHGGALNNCVSRIIHPDPGDPVCDVISFSGGYNDEALVFVEFPTLGPMYHLVYEDAAIQGVTVCLPTGDTGSGSSVGDGKDHASGSIDPYILAVGGTVIGNINGNQFVEWLASIGNTIEANFLSGGGGGVSIYVPLPSYQEGFNVPPSTNSGTVGRGIPDVSSCFAGQFPMFDNGVLTTSFGGTSQSTPMTAGLIASVSHAIGRNCGFLNPSLYAQAGTVIRDINPGNTVGGPQTNSNGFVAIAGEAAPLDSYVPVPGYPLAFGWDACVGLGVIKGNALVTYLNGVTPPAATYTVMQYLDNTLCSYWGGNVMDGAQITVIYWGTGWETATTPSSANITTAITAIINAGYFDLMNEYYVFNRPSIIGTYNDTSSSATVSATNAGGVITNLVANLNAQHVPIATTDNHLYLYLISDGTPTAGSAQNVWIDYNGTVVQIATVFTQPSGIANWTPTIIREIVGSMTGGNGYPSGWNLFSSNTDVLSGTLYCNNTVGLSQVSNWHNDNLGTSAGYSVLGYYSNIIRGTIIAGTP